MPRLADHALRRTQITDAARRVIARSGLAAATFQSVAAGAGISVRLVQYYFGTKQEVLLATHQAVAADAGKRVAGRLATLGDGATPRDVLRALLGELLPTDGPRREDAIVLGAFHAASLTDGEVDPGDTLGAPRYLQDVVAEQLRRARHADPGPDDGRALDAYLVVAATGGLAQAMLVDPTAASRAEDLLDRLLDHMLPR